MKIVTDSSVMFSVEDGARRGMTVLPLVVAIDGQTWLEYEDISAEEFLAKVRAGALPQSASPPPALTLAAYDTDDEVIHLAMADGLSGAYEVACGLVKQARHPERVQVVNCLLYTSRPRTRVRQRQSLRFRSRTPPSSGQGASPLGLVVLLSRAWLPPPIVSPYCSGNDARCV